MNTIKVKSKTQIATQSNKPDILALYGVGNLCDEIIEKEKQNLFSFFSFSFACANELKNMLDTSSYSVEIPSKFREMLKNGTASFDNSSKLQGGYSPNIRIKGENGIAGQAVIVENNNVQAICDSISNLAMMAYMQSILEELKEIKEGVSDINIGQRNDRIAKALSAFKSFTVLYPTVKSKEELMILANSAFLEMQEGLTAFHLSIDEKKKKLDKAPKSNLQFFWSELCSPIRNQILKYRSLYYELTHDINLYYRLVVLADLLLIVKGNPEQSKANHSQINSYCDYLKDEDFLKKMNFVTDNDISELQKIFNFKDKLNNAILSYDGKDISVEINKTDVEQIQNKCYEN